MKNDAVKYFRKLSRHNFHEIWERAKANDLDDLTNEEKLIAQIMLEHEDEYLTDFEMADVLDEYEYSPQNDVNPFLHILIHLVVENQLRDRDPIEVFQFYNAMQRRRVSRHETIHLIGYILIPFLFETLKEKKPFDEEGYRLVLKHLKNKRPEKIADALERELKRL